MRVLLLLRGAPGVGKSTFIEQNGLSAYALSADTIRMMVSPVKMNEEGRDVIDQTQDNEVWSILFRILDTRMKNGEFVVIDATNSKTSEMNRYKSMCEEYKYRIYCIDFTDVPIEEVKRRNAGRPEYKVVPEEAIDNMYARFETQKIPAGITVIKPDELDKIWFKKHDLSRYDMVHVIGDIHGCYTALKKYIDSCGGFKDSEAYIFLGDYIDHGIENAEVIKFLLENYERENVFLLEGNHERWLWVWANGGTTKSREFELCTMSQLEESGIDKKSVRKLYRRIGQCAYFDYGDKIYFVSHGGISRLPDNLTLVSTKQMVHGVGRYDDYINVDKSFEAHTGDNVYQIHGHRNPKHLPAKIGNRTYTLEDGVEFGGNLRCMQLVLQGDPIVVETRNDVFKQKEEFEKKYVGEERKVGDLIMDMRNNRYIREKKFGNISSFNFTTDAFYKGIWDEQTMKARGLFIDVQNQKVAARAYDKFFNVGERPETEMNMLQYKMDFPAVAYVKENGFLGIVSYDAENDSLFITSKSDPTGDFSKWLTEAIENNVSLESMEKIKNYAKDNNVSFVFECVDMRNDPHIIRYDKASNLFLLDIVKNDLKFEKMTFDEMCKLSDELGLVHKELAYKFDTYQDFFDWYHIVTHDGYTYNGRNIEGFVVEGANGYMTKIKTAYYHFWKHMRSVAYETIRRGALPGKKTSSLTTPLANKFYRWVRDYREANKDNLDNIPKDIITLRNLFFASYPPMYITC